MNINFNNIFLKLNFYLLIFLPVGIISGPFLADLIISLSSILFLFLLINNYKNIHIHKIYIFMFFAYCIYLIILSIFSENIILSLQSSLFYLRFGIFLMNIVFMINNSKNFLKYFSYVFILTYSFVIIDALIQYFYGLNFFGFEKDHNRLSGIFNTEKILGSYLSRFLPIFLALFLLINKVKYFANYIMILVLCLSFFLIILSGERTALFYFVIFFAFFTIFITNFRNVKILSLIIIIFTLIFTLISDNNIKNRIIVLTKYQLNISNEIDTGRFRLFSIQHEVIYSTAFKIIKDNYLFGIGPKMFREICKLEKYQSKSKLDGSINGCQTHPHNSYIQLLTETGLIGLIPLLFIFIYLNYILLKLFINKYFYKVSNFTNVEIMLIASIYINLWPFVPNGNFFNNWLSCIYFLPISILIGILYKNKKNSNYEPKF